MSIYNPIVEEGRDRQVPKAHRPAASLVNQYVLDSVRNPVSKNKVHNNKGRHPMSGFGLHTHVHMHTDTKHTGVCAYIYYTHKHLYTCIYKIWTMSFLGTGLVQNSLRFGA